MNIKSSESVIMKTTSENNLLFVNCIELYILNANIYNENCWRFIKNTCIMLLVLQFTNSLGFESHPCHQFSCILRRQLISCTKVTSQKFLF